VAHELSGKKCPLFPQGKKTTFAPRFKYMIIQFSCSLITFEVEIFSGIFVESSEQELKDKPELIARRSFSTFFFKVFC